MPKTLKLGDLSKRIRDVKLALAAAKKVESVGKGGKSVNKATVKAAVTALENAEKKVARICQQGVFGVKVSP